MSRKVARAKSAAREADPALDSGLVVLVYEVHLSIDVGMRNLGVFCLVVERETWAWHDVLVLCTFDICRGVETGGKRCTSLVVDNAVQLLDALRAIRGARRVFIEEQFVSTFGKRKGASKGAATSTGTGGKSQMNLEARHLEFALLGYFRSRMRAWGVEDMRVHRVPPLLKLRGSPKELKGNKPAYKEWTRLEAVGDLRGRGFEEAALVVESSSKGDDAGDAVKQYVNASEEVKADASKYLW
jgi:hypothetical protein